MNRALIALLFAFAARGARAQANELHLFNWNDYIAPETVERFQQACKCKVVQTYYSGQRRARGQARRGREGLRRARADLELCPRHGESRLDPAARPPSCRTSEERDAAHRGGAYDPGNKYSAPYAMSITLIGYNEAKIKELGVPVDSWAAIFDPKIVPS